MWTGLTIKLSFLADCSAHYFAHLLCRLARYWEKIFLTFYRFKFLPWCSLINRNEIKSHQSASVTDKILTRKCCQGAGIPPSFWTLILQGQAGCSLSVESWVQFNVIQIHCQAHPMVYCTRGIADFVTLFNLKTFTRQLRNFQSTHWELLIPNSEALKHSDTRRQVKVVIESQRKLVKFKSNISFPVL